MPKSLKKILLCIIIAVFVCQPPAVAAQTTTFNPHFILSDTELQDSSGWTNNDVQIFLDSKGSYLRNYKTEDVDGTVKPAGDIIYQAARNYQINPKFLLVTLQKEQSLITDPSPTQKQLDWATGYGVCDDCRLSDPDVQKHRGFAKQVDNAAGLMRWYYDNKNTSAAVKKKDTPIRIDGQEVVPQSWATAFLYTYTPHLHGNQNFTRLWDAWFGQIYPEGSLLRSVSSTDVWLIQNGQRRKFKNQTVLITRADPKLIITVPASEISNYGEGPAISFSNYSLLKTNTRTYLLDYDTLRPFASDEVVRKLGYNPQEMIDVSEADLSGYAIGSPITLETIAPQGVIYQITDYQNKFYLMKDNVLYPILHKSIVGANYKHLKLEKHQLKELSAYQVADLPINFNNGTLIQANRQLYVIEKGRKRSISEDAFIAMGYKTENIIAVDSATAMYIPEGERIHLDGGLLAARGGLLAEVGPPAEDLYGTQLPAYILAEYPSGNIIAGKNIDKRRPIASLTKLITAYEALKQGLEFDKTTAYDAAKHSSYGNPLQLVKGEAIKNKDLFYASLVGSVNNAARMMVGAVGMEEDFFVTSMNARLKRWGAGNTSLADVTGLDDNNKSTPRDLAKIFAKILDSGKIKEALAKDSYKFREVVNKNKVSTHTVLQTNKLVAQKGRNYKILASKTGYTEEAGAILAMLIESAKGKKQYILITMGNGDYERRFDEPGKIARWIAEGKVKIAASK